MKPSRIFYYENKMTKENNIKFAYIAGKKHGSTTISAEQLEKIMKILYG